MTESIRLATGVTHEDQALFHEAPHTVTGRACRRARRPCGLRASRSMLCTTTVSQSRGNCISSVSCGLSASRRRLCPCKPGPKPGLELVYLNLVPRTYAHVPDSLSSTGAPPHSTCQVEFKAPPRNKFTTHPRGAVLLTALSTSG